MQTITENILNVTLLEPRQKHPTIFVRFDELTEGESLTIQNDHDPNHCIINYWAKEEIYLPGNTWNRGLKAGK